jgi:hypothetical protein
MGGNRREAEIKVFYHPLLSPLPSRERIPAIPSFGVNHTIRTLMGGNQKKVQLTIFQDRSYDTFSVFQHIIVPEAQHLEPLLLQPSGSLFVFSLAFYVLTTIHLNDYLIVEADEINYVIAYGFLSSEFQTVESLRPKISPQ